MRLVRIILVAAALAALTAGTALAAGGNSDAAHACQQGGYADLVGSGGETFSNTGECVSFAAHGGTFATEPPEPPVPTGVIVVPAGSTVTFDNPTISACNQLSWGYTIGAGSVFLGGKAGGCQTVPEIEPDVTIGPFATAVELTVFLVDHTCFATYDTTGDHAIVTQSSPTTWDVDIADAGGSCERVTTPVVFVPPGNLSVDVVVTP